MKFPVIDFELTSKCNLRCEFCFGPENGCDIFDLPTEVWFQAIDYFWERGVKAIVFTGGEPTLRTDLYQIVSYAKQLGFMTILSTNGRQHNETVQCVDVLDWLCLPLDSTDTKINRKMRGDDWLLNSLAKLILDSKKVNPSIKIKIGTVISEVNVFEIGNIYNALLTIEDTVDIWKLYQCTYTPTSFRRFEKFAISTNNFLKIVNPIQDDFKGRRFKVTVSSIFDRRRAYVFVYPDGTVSIPDMGTNVNDLIIGNIGNLGSVCLDQDIQLDLKNMVSNFHATYGFSF